MPDINRSATWVTDRIEEVGTATENGDYALVSTRDISDAPVICTYTPSFDTLPATFYHPKVTSNHVLPEGGGYRLSNSSAMTGNWQVETFNGSYRITGTGISGTTVLYLTFVYSTDTTASTSQP